MATFTFGKHNGKTVTEVMASDESYLVWAMKKDIIENTQLKIEVREALGYERVVYGVDSDQFIAEWAYMGMTGSVEQKKAMNDLFNNGLKLDNERKTRIMSLIKKIHQNSK